MLLSMLWCKNCFSSGLDRIKRQGHGQALMRSVWFGRWRYFSDSAMALPKVASLRNSLRNQPDNVGGWLEMSRLLMQMGGKTGGKHALYALSNGLDANRDSLDLWLAYLDLFDASSTLQEVREMAEHAVKSIPGDARLRIRLAQSQSCIDASLACLDAASSDISPDSAMGDLALCGAYLLCLGGRPADAAQVVSLHHER